MDANGAAAASSRAMKLVYSAAHTLDASTLRARVDARLDYYAAKFPAYDPRKFVTWRDANNAVANYRGGHLAVALLPHSVDLTLDLPFFARLYKSRIEHFVRDELAAITAPA